MERFIENSLSYSIADKFKIASIEGNFIMGFRLKELSYEEDSTIIFSAQEIYIDPDLSHLILGSISLSEVIIKNPFYNHNYSFTPNQQFNAANNNFFSFNYEITSIKLENALILFMDNMYDLNGEFAFRYNNDEYQIKLSTIVAQTINFPSNLTLLSGIINLHENEVKVTKLIANSEWFSGSINGNYNIEDINQISGLLEIDNVEYVSEGGALITVHELTAEIKNNKDVPSITIKTDLEYKDTILSNIHINGSLMNGIALIDSAYMQIDGERIRFSGNFDLLNYNWDASIMLDSFNPKDGHLISGIVKVYSPYLFEEIIGEIELENSIIDSIMISSILGNFRYNDGLFDSEKITFSSNQFNGDIKVHFLRNSKNFNISGEMVLDEYITPFSLNDLRMEALSGKIAFKWLQDSTTSELSAHVNLHKGLLLKEDFNLLQADVAIKVNNQIYNIKSSGLLTGWNYGPYTLNTINYNIDHADNDSSYYQVNVSSATDDSLKIHVERDQAGGMIITELKGVLKDSEIKIPKPFYIKNSNNIITIPKVNITLGNSEFILKGKYENNHHYKMFVDIHNLNLDNIYSVIGKSYQIYGTIKNAQFVIEKNDEKPPPFSRIFIENIDLLAGNIDEIQFNSLTMSAIYSNNSFLLNNFELETDLGNINAKDSNLNFGLTNNGIVFQKNDQVNLFFTFKNIDIANFNIYTPWEYESRGLMTGNLSIKGSVRKHEIVSNIEIARPSLDKINAEHFKGIFEYKDNQLNTNFSIQTVDGIYSGMGDFPFSHNLFETTNFDISDRQIDFILTGLTNNIEYLPPYFDILDSLSSIYSLEDSLNSYSLKIDITGTLANPIRNGYMDIRNAILFLDPIEEPIKNINGIIKISNNQLIINELTGSLNKIDKSTFNFFKKIFSSKEDAIQNNINVTGSIDLADLLNPDYALGLKGENISLTSSYDYFQGAGDININITGRDTVRIKGQLIPEPYDFTITTLESDKSIYIPKIYTNRIISYDLHVPINEPIRLTTDNINILFEGDMNISKIDEKHFNFSGKAEIIDGSFYDNQGNIFQNTNGTILLSPVDNIAYIDIHAQTMVDTLIDVSLIGYSDNPILFFHTEDYTQTEILKILTFDNTENLNEPAQAGNLLSNYLENEVERSFARYSKLDDFQLTSKGNILETIEGNDVDINVMFGKQISNRIYINTQINLNKFSNNRYEATYRLNKNNSLVGGMDENNLLHLKYRIKYYY